MSDFYYVGGKVAPATAFGQYFTGDKWGPLDSSVVKANLTLWNLLTRHPNLVLVILELRLMTTALTPIRWSDGVTTNSSFQPSNEATCAFNGLTSGSGSAADIAGSGTSDYILVSDFGFTGTHSVKKKAWSQAEINGVVVTSKKQ